jgi:hypothetical protein
MGYLTGKVSAHQYEEITGVAQKSLIATFPQGACNEQDSKNE